MKKFIILIIAMMTLPLRYASAQCQNSPEFTKSLEFYKHFEAHDSFYLDYSNQSLKSKLYLIHSALSALRFIQNQEDYATFLSEVQLGGNLPIEVTNHYYAEMDSASFIFKDKDYNLIKLLNNLYQIYLEELSENKFTVEALSFVTDQIKYVKVVTNKEFEVYPQITLRKPVDEYTNYQIYILTYFCAIQEVADLAPLMKDRSAVASAIKKLNASNCPMYAELGKELQLELE